MSFPRDFVWGAATSAYQIEGAAFDEGRGASVWDMLSRKPEAIYRGHTGDVAANHYYCYLSDVGIMREIGLQAYRFSVSWPRVIPAGTGAVNEAGLAFYDRLVDALLEANITPWLTLFHWDFPHELYCKGGWLNPDSPQWFADHTAVVVDRLGDRVVNWMTLNEPQVFIGMGHYQGIHAPGDKLGLAEVLRAGHNSLLAHGLAAQVIRARAKTPPQVGWAPVGVAAVPATDSPEDIAAARFATLESAHYPLWSNGWFSDPVIFGSYPQAMLEKVGAAAPVVGPNDMATIAQPIDFYGANIYHAEVVRANAEGLPELVPQPPGVGITTMNWAVVPEALYWGPRFLHERYGKPIVITENGTAVSDWVSADGAVHDPARIDFTHRYLASLRRSIADGADVRGYFHWSLMDNFEWAEGYKQRFGMVFVDFQTQQRIIKDSGRWYAGVIASNGASLADVPIVRGWV